MNSINKHHNRFNLNVFVTNYRAIHLVAGAHKKRKNKTKKAKTLIKTHNADRPTICHSSSNLILVKKHIGNPLIYGKLPPGLRADQSSLFDMKLQERMMKLPQKLMVGFEDGRLGSFLRELGVAHYPRRVDECFPLDLGENVPQEIVIDLDLLLHHFLRLDTEREAVGHPLDV